MESIQRKAFLVKDHTMLYFQWVPNWLGQSNCSGHAVLYEGNFGGIKLCRMDSDVDENLTNTFSAVEQILNQSIDRSCIQMFAKYDKTIGNVKLSASLCFGDSFVNSLSNALVEPKITIEGIFGVNSKSPSPFKIAGSELKLSSYVEDVEGTENIKQLLNSWTSLAGFSITYSIILEWKDLKMTVRRESSTVLDELLSRKLLTDCCIIAAGNKEVSCHRSILAAHSDVIYAMLTSGLEESQTNKIDMMDINEEVVGLLLAFVYGRKINTEEMKEEIAYDLIRTAHKYNILLLQELMAVTLFNKPNDTFNMNTVLDLYFFTLRVEELSALHEKVVNILKTNPNKVLASAVYQELLENSPKEASKLALKLLGLVIGEPNCKALPAC